jgi:hypothetical protein
VTVPLSKRSDAQLLAVVWVLTLVVLGIGIAATAVILLVWGGIGLIGAAVATVIYVRGRHRPPSVGEHPEGPT